MPSAPPLATFSARAQARLRRPRTRGAFAPIDSARRQLGLISVADGEGQANISWLVDLATSTIADARFLAFGDISSHPIADVFTECVRGRTVADACRLTAEQLDALLRDDPATPAFGELGLAPYAFVADLQRLAEAELPSVRLLPKPDETPVYQRKRPADWTAEDQAWLPLNLMRKAAKVEEVVTRTLAERVERIGLRWKVVEINDDLRVRIALANVAAEQVPTLCKFLEDALRGAVHSGIVVEPVEEAKP